MLLWRRRVGGRTSVPRKALPVLLDSAKPIMKYMAMLIALSTTFCMAAALCTSYIAMFV